MEERGDAKLHHLSPQTHPRRRLGTSAAAPSTVPDAMAPRPQPLLRHSLRRIRPGGSSGAAASAPPWPRAASTQGHASQARSGRRQRVEVRRLRARDRRRGGRGRRGEAGREEVPPAAARRAGGGRTGLGSIGHRWRRSICALLAQARHPPPRRLPLSSLGSPRCSCGGAPRWPSSPPSSLVAVKAMAGLLQLPPPAGCGAAPPPPSPARWRPGEGPRGELVRGRGGHARARALRARVRRRRPGGGHGRACAR